MPGSGGTCDFECYGEGHGPGFAARSRRLEIVADGLPLHGGMQLAVDTTLVSPLLDDGSARPGAAEIDGTALKVARRRKERTFPELIGPRARTGSVGGPGRRGGRPLVRRDAHFPQEVGPRQSQIGATYSSGQNRRGGCEGLPSWHAVQYHC